MGEDCKEEACYNRDENTRNEEKAKVGKVRNQSIERASFIEKVVWYDGEEEETEHFKDKFKVKTDMTSKTTLRMQNKEKALNVGRKESYFSNELVTDDLLGTTTPKKRKCINARN